MLDRDRVLAWLGENVSPRRLQHILSVEQTSLELARLHRVDEDKAAVAGLLHDLAKFFPPAKLLEMMAAEGSQIDPVCAANPHLLHADASAIVARDEFGVEDEEILTAIRNHTLGSPQMSELSCIIFVADAIEPLRGNSPELEKLRLLSKEDLDKSLQQTCDYSLRYLIDTYRIIHPRTVLTRNWAVEKVKKKQLLQSEREKVSTVNSKREKINDLSTLS